MCTRTHRAPRFEGFKLKSPLHANCRRPLLRCRGRRVISNWTYGAEVSTTRRTALRLSCLHLNSAFEYSSKACQGLKDTQVRLFPSASRSLVHLGMQKSSISMFLSYRMSSACSAITPSRIVHHYQPVSEYFKRIRDFLEPHCIVCRYTLFARDFSRSAEFPNYRKEASKWNSKNRLDTTLHTHEVAWQYMNAWYVTIDKRRLGFVSRAMTTSEIVLRLQGIFSKHPLITFHT